MAAATYKDLFSRILEDRVVLSFLSAFYPQVNSSFYRDKEVILPQFFPSMASRKKEQLHNLVVRRALLIYLERAASFRQ